MSRIDPELLEEEWDEDFRPMRTRMSERAQARINRDDPGRVVVIDRGRVTVLFEGELLEATYAGSMRGEKLVVGDRVRVRPPRHDGDTPRVTERLERQTALRRTPDDNIDDDERIVVANADQVVVVIGADYLDGGARFVDRVLVAASAGGLDALVCVNKVDVASADDSGAVGDQLAAVSRIYEGIGIEVLHASAKTGEGVEELSWRLEGCWTVMTGHSGVGKSSLFNRLLPAADQDVKEVGRRGGRHTTVASRALPVPGHDDAWLVDTPGVRSFGLGFVEPVDLRLHFPELRELTCELPDCMHDGEPGCTIETAKIDPARLLSYRRLLSSLRGDDRYEADEWASEPAGGDDDAG